MNKVCFGCGSILQSDDELKPGFIPLNKIDDAKYCKRCFRLTHYGDKNTLDIEKSTKAILDNVNKDNIFKIYMVDFLNINNNTMSLFNKIKGNKMLLISKIDLIDNNININRTIDNIKKIYDIKCDIKIISVNDDIGINGFKKYLEKNNISKCYMLGPTNSGKSTLINKLIDKFNNNINKLTISNKRNTTLEFIRIKLNDNITLIDSPGFLLKDYNLNSKYKNIIKPKTFNMKDNEVLLIDKFYIKFKNNTSVTIYNYDNLKINKYYKEIKYDYNLDIDSNTDICINGFGFIRIKNKNNISISNLDKELISIRKSIFGGLYE